MHLSLQRDASGHLSPVRRSKPPLLVGSSERPGFVTHHPPQSVVELRMEEATKEAAGVPTEPLPTVEARKRAAQMDSRRQRTASALGAAEALPGDAPVRKLTTASGVRLHVPTILYGKPSEMNNAPKLHMRIPSYAKLVNVQAPLRSKMGHMMDHHPHPADQEKTLATTFGSTGPVTGLRPTSTPGYGRNVDLRDASTKFRLMQKERKAAAARRQLDMLETSGLPLSRSASASTLGTRSLLRTVPLGAARQVPVSPVAPDPSSLDAASTFDPSSFPFSQSVSGGALPTAARPKAVTGQAPPAARSRALSTFDRTTRTATATGLPNSTSLLCTSALDGVDVLAPAAALPVPLDKGSSVALAHLNRKARKEDNAYQRAYVRYAAHRLVCSPTSAAFGSLRLHIEYCFPISIQNTSLTLKRFRVSALYLKPGSAAARLRCRYAAIRLAPGMKVDLVVILRGDEAGDVEGVLELSSDDGVSSLAIKATILTAMDFSNALARYSKPQTEDGDGDDVLDSAFVEYLLPLGHTHPEVVPLLAPS